MDGLCGRDTIGFWFRVFWSYFSASLGKLFSLCLMSPLVPVRLSCLPCAYCRATVDQMMLIISNTDLMSRPVLVSSEGHFDTSLLSFNLLRLRAFGLSSSQYSSPLSFAFSPHQQPESIPSISHSLPHIIYLQLKKNVLV